jgi:Bifunctional DNA primase/polymerase, N-terminal/Protein of unknown function (DUF3987)/Primase C terminal 1 (PriCT-1)
MRGCLDAALAHASRGRRVFPVKRNKAPYTKNGFLDATTDEATIRGWWDEYPDAGVGAAMGDGLFVLDIDDESALAALESEHGRLPPTVEAVTPRPGRHLYFRGDVGISEGSLPKGIHVRGQGGYVLLPPSPHENGGFYEWKAAPDEIPYAPAPSSLLALIRDAHARRNGHAPPVGDEIPDGERDVKLTSLAGSMRNRGMSEKEMLAALLVVNADRCKPPLPASKVEKIAASVARYAPGEFKQSSNPLRESSNARIGEDENPPALGAIPEYPVDALPTEARRLVLSAGKSGLPLALTGGAALAAMAGAIGGNTQIQVTSSWHERPILWIPLLAPRGAGKSPAQEIAFAPLRSHDVKAGDDGGRILLDDMTLEALARELSAMGGAGAFDLDELSQLLRGLGEYKRGSADRSRFLKLWEGAPWGFKRVGTGKATNAVRLSVDRPTVVVCGGLQPQLHALLGPDEDGMRPRWLPHLAEMPKDPELTGTVSFGWNMLIEHLLSKRSKERTWTLNESGRKSFERHRRAWKDQSRHAESPAVEGALTKADKHLARVALVFAEADQPGVGGDVGSGPVDRAAEIIEFTVDCWRALPEQASLMLTQRDRALYPGVDTLYAWIERRPERIASTRQIQMARVAGARTPAALEALLERYLEVYPGSAVTESSNHGGKATVWWTAPRRDPTVATGNTGMHSDGNPDEHEGSSGVATGNSGSGNTEDGNSGEAE